MTEAQKLVDEFRTATAPGTTTNTWKWARRVTSALTFLENSKIGSQRGGHTYSIAVFRCADGSRFAYDLNGARQTWAIDHQS